MQRKLPIYKVSGKEKPPYKTKIFTKNEKEQKILIQNYYNLPTRYRNGILNFKICHDDNEQKRKLEITERIELYNLEIIRSIGEKELKNLWNLKIMVIRIVVRLYGTATKYQGKIRLG